MSLVGGAIYGELGLHKRLFDLALIIASAYPATDLTSLDYAPGTVMAMIDQYILTCPTVPYDWQRSVSQKTSFFSPHI